MKSENRMAVSNILDTGDLRCPLPVLKAAARLKAMQPGQILRIICRDQAASIDFEVFCHHNPHELVAKSVKTADSDEAFVIDIRCGDKAHG